ncbi:MAG: hypothetical protein A2045_16990 [Rhodocyclales bacterium GWA2_65_20]|nr:MAG: hypothetical protein A2045_16990 [Rhodocyclales bacterium GWA2_65_20]
MSRISRSATSPEPSCSFLICASMRAPSRFTWASTGRARAATASRNASVTHQKARAAGVAWVVSITATELRISVMPLGSFLSHLSRPRS